MFRLRINTIRILAVLVGMGLAAGVFGPGEAAARRKDGPLDATLKSSGAAATWIEAFMKTGDVVAERDLELFKADLLRTYRCLERDERNLTWLFMRCDRSWGATAFALAMQAAAKESLRVVLMDYDAAGRNWERTATGMGLLSGGRRPSYTFNAYLSRQQETWTRILENPMRWRETYLLEKQ